MTEKQFTIKEMQTWNKKYRLDKEDITKVIDTTMEDTEFWTVHENEAYNLCIELNDLNDENEKLKKQEKRLYKYFRKCFDNVSHQDFRETWEVVKNND